MIGNLTQNVSPHNWEDEFVRFLLLFKLDGVRVGRFSGKRNSSKGIHDHVYPQELNNTERWVSKSSTSKENNDKADNVNYKLELDELSDVVKNVSSPLGSSVD